MKAFIILLVCLMLFQHCQKDHDENSLPCISEKGLKAKMTTTNGPGKVGVCHRTESGSYIPIEVSQSALSTHLRHGDYVSDADNDGFTAEGACTGSADDCNDNDPDVNPGAAEVCGDQLDNNCDGNVDEGCCTVPTELVGQWTGFITNHRGFETISVNITSTLISVTYSPSNCTGTWAIDCVNSTPGTLLLTETITSGNCTPIQCLQANYDPSGSSMQVFSSPRGDCIPESFVRGTVLRH